MSIDSSRVSKKSCAAHTILSQLASSQRQLRNSKIQTALMHSSRVLKKSCAVHTTLSSLSY